MGVEAEAAERRRLFEPERRIAALDHRKQIALDARSDRFAFRTVVIGAAHAGDRLGVMAEIGDRLSIRIPQRIERRQHLLLVVHQVVASAVARLHGAYALAYLQVMFERLGRGLRRLRLSRCLLLGAPPCSLLLRQRQLANRIGWRRLGFVLVVSLVEPCGCTGEPGSKKTRPPRVPVGRGAASCCRFECRHEARRSRLIDPLRPYERLDEPPASLGRLLRVANRRFEMRSVLRHIGGDMEQSAVDGLQMPEVQRAFLGLAELRGQQRVDTAADDRALDLRARVHADDGGAVMNRVEVLGARVGVYRVAGRARPDRDVPQIAEVRALPRTSVLRMRTHQHAGVSQRRRRGANLVDPSPYEWRFIGRNEFR